MNQRGLEVLLPPPYRVGPSPILRSSMPRRPTLPLMSTLSSCKPQRDSILRSSQNHKTSKRNPFCFQNVLLQPFPETTSELWIPPPPRLRSFRPITCWYIRVLNPIIPPSYVSPGFNFPDFPPTAQTAGDRYPTPALWSPLPPGIPSNSFLVISMRSSFPPKNSRV